MQAPTGRDNSAQANGLGFGNKALRQALKGRPNLSKLSRDCRFVPRSGAEKCIALSGLGGVTICKPRPLAWAELLRPFGAENFHRREKSAEACEKSGLKGKGWPIQPSPFKLPPGS